MCDDHLYRGKKSGGEGGTINARGEGIGGGKGGWIGCESGIGGPKGTASPYNALNDIHGLKYGVTLARLQHCALWLQISNALAARRAERQTARFLRVICGQENAPETQ